MKIKKLLLTLIAVITALDCVMFAGCSDKNESASITSWEVPSKYTEERADHEGKVVEFSYTAYDYVLESGSVEEKKLNVYLPYGYDETRRYNVIYLLHGSDKQSVIHRNTWLYSIGVKNILDNMIYYGDIEPLIVVTPCFYSYGLYGDDTMNSVKEVTPTKENSMNNFGKELRYDIIPAVEAKFSTYAESVTDTGLIASREHRAMAGLSAGCKITYLGGMCENFDYIGWFGCYSSYIDAQTIIDAFSSSKYEKYELYYMFNADGVYDFAYNGHSKMVKELLNSEKFTDKNTEYVDISFGRHSARSWRVAFYDSLQRFFK